MRVRKVVRHTVDNKKKKWRTAEINSNFILSSALQSVPGVSSRNTCEYILFIFKTAFLEKVTSGTVVLSPQLFRLVWEK